MEFLTKIHLGAVIATMLRELGNWSWDNPFCVAMFAFFVLGCIPQFILLRMKWKPWLISLTLGCLIILCDFCAMFLTGMVFDVLTLIEAFFIAALVGSAGGGAAHFFWEIFKKKDPDHEDSVWSLRKSSKEEEDVVEESKQ